MRKLRLLGVVDASALMVVVIAAVLVYGAASLSNQNIGQRLPQLNRPVRGHTLPVNTSPATSMFPGGFVSSPQPSPAPNPAPVPAASPVYPSACRLMANPTIKCGPIFCPERLMSDGYYPSCGCRGMQMGEVACLAE